jgi:hypothetical protein
MKISGFMDFDVFKPKPFKPKPRIALENRAKFDFLLKNRTSLDSFSDKFLLYTP